MSGYIHEFSSEFDRHYRGLQMLAFMSGIEVPQASKRVVAELPIHKIAAEEVTDALNCVVCQLGATAGDTYKILPCKHEFHEECILLWFKKTNSCPLCRFELETDDKVYEHLRIFREDEPNQL